MMRELLVRQIDLIAWRRSFRRRRWRLAARLLACRLLLGLAGCKLGFMLGQLALVALFGARFDLGFGFGDFLQPPLAARQFIRYRHSIGKVCPVRSFSLRQKLRNLGLQLRLNLACVLVGQRAVLAGVGVDLLSRPGQPSPTSKGPSRAPKAKS